MWSDFEIERENKILPHLRVHEHVVTGAMRIECTVFNGRARFRAVAVPPAVESFTVEEQEPAVVPFGFGKRIFSDGTDFFHPNIPIADKLLREIAAAMDLQSDSAGVRMAARRF